MEKRISQAYETARERYAALGVDTEAALELLKGISVSIHCWQGDDVGGFEVSSSSLNGSGLQVTGNYPGKARNLVELQADLTQMYSLLPGHHRLNLHAIYGDFGGKPVDRDEILPAHFSNWAEWGREHGIELDFNATCFGHPRAADGFTLAHRDPGVRAFWIEHAVRCREIGAFLGSHQQTPCLHNLWIPDGSKDATSERMACRSRLKDSLDRIYARPYDRRQLKDSVESKLFGIGSESFVAGSHEFYLAYALQHGLIYCLDLGHFHPTEAVADKISALLLFFKELLLHVSRGVRWDSDHVALYNDETTALCQEIVRSGRQCDINLALDYFDATINRIGAWVIGARALLKALLFALLEPGARLCAYEAEGNLFARLALQEELKAFPLGAVWDYYCLRENCPIDREIVDRVCAYEKNILRKRV